MHQETARSLLDALDVCREIYSLCQDVTLAEYSNQRLRYLSVERLFEIAGEAMNRADRYDRAQIRQLKQAGTLIGLRNRLAHDYDNISLSILWDTAVNDLPPLIAEIETLLERHGHQEKAFE
ncbi:MAG: DUF86 domain-containing protein [Thermomicrobiales bacterium]